MMLVLSFVRDSRLMMLSVFSRFFFSRVISRLSTSTVASFPFNTRMYA